MFLGYSPRPASRRKILERFGLANAFEGITQNGVNQIENAHRQFAVGLDPIA